MDWEARYQLGDTPWDLGMPAPPLEELMESWEGLRKKSGQVLVPGCGAGHDAVALQRSGREVVGLDMAPSALEKARVRYGSKVQWVLGDFFDPDLAGRYEVDTIFEHTCFCAIEPKMRKRYVQAASRWLSEKGSLVGVFFLDPPRREDQEAGPPYRTSREELAALFTSEFQITREAAPNRSHFDRIGREWLVEMVRKD